MYIKVTGSYPTAYTLAQLRRDNPNVSFPKDIPDSTLVEFGVFPLAETVPPSGDVVEEVTPSSNRRGMGAAVDITRLHH
jgi:hypothetical protein